MSVLIEQDSITYQRNYNNLISNTVAIDLSCEYLTYDSNNKYSQMPAKIDKINSKFSKFDTLLSKKNKKSNNYNKLRDKKLSKLRKIKNIKKDFIHKFTNIYAKNHGIVVIENLDIESIKTKGNKYINKILSLRCLGQFKQYLQYKCLKFGTTLIKVSPYYETHNLPFISLVS